MEKIGSKVGVSVAAVGGIFDRVPSVGSSSSLERTPLNNVPATIIAIAINAIPVAAILIFFQRFLAELEKPYENSLLQK